MNTPKHAQEDDTQKVTGPESFITDGTRKLNLTCGTDASEDVAYTWFLPLGNGPRGCDSQTPINVCTFVPRVDDDTQDVICMATGRNGSQLFRATYALNLTYPPESSAAITIEPRRTEPLKQGDNITCTVTGGKPRVLSVTLYCQHPDLADREDDVSDDGRTVSSSITVDTSQTTAVNMTCTCFAHWDPEPELYDNITNAEFMLEYKSIVTNFTVNGNTSKTVAESEMAMFRCQGAGRPSPTLILRKHGYGTAITDGSDSEKGLLHAIDSARCEDLGNYTCEANNTLLHPNSGTVQLFVKLTPTQPTTPSDVDAGVSSVTIVVIVVPCSGCATLGFVIVIVVIKKRRNSCSTTRE
ncbi:uncharacterized protein [Littorina saxatilis]|uniref:uncharacterized protein n=1 Tax=Littorina saxatilis TaxID=31220 RepID=UPI0038B65DAE